MKFLIFLILTIINFNFINCQTGSCSTFGKTGSDCSYTLQYIGNYGSVNLISPTITFNNTINIYKIQLEKLVEVDDNGNSVNTMLLNNSVITSQTTTTINYQSTLVPEGLFKIKINLNLINNGTSNYTNIDYTIGVTGYKFITSTNKLKLYLNSTISSLKVPTSQICSSSGVDPLRSTIINNVFGNSILQGNFTKSALKIDTVDKIGLIVNFINFTNTINSTFISTNSQNVLSFPAFNTSLDYAFTYNFVVSPIPLNSSNVDYMYTTCFKITAQTGLTGQEKAAICIGVIGFTILGAVAAYFFILKGRYIFKEQ